MNLYSLFAAGDLEDNPDRLENGATLWSLLDRPVRTRPRSRGPGAGACLGCCSPGPEPMCGRDCARGKK